MVAQAAMKVYMFHNCQFCAPVMSPFFWSHEPFDDITLDDIHPPFHPPRYLTEGESNSNTCLTLTYLVESDPSESTYLMYSMEPDPSEPSYPSVNCLSSDSSASSAASQAPPPVCGRGFIHTRVAPRWHGRAWGGGCGDDALGGFRNGYLPFDGWFA